MQFIDIVQGAGIVLYEFTQRSDLNAHGGDFHIQPLKARPVEFGKVQTRLWFPFVFPKAAFFQKADAVISAVRGVSVQFVGAILGFA